jgi:hypothetical protein
MNQSDTALVTKATGEIVLAADSAMQAGHFQSEARPQDNALHDLGQQFIASMESGKELFIDQSYIVFQAWENLSRRGKESQFGRWISFYTDLSRTHAYRLVAVARCFVVPYLNCPSVGQFELTSVKESLGKIKLTALCHLSSSAVPQGARDEALFEARTSVVTPARAIEIIKKYTVPVFGKNDKSSVPGRKRKGSRRTFDVDGGKVIVRASDGDIGKLLKSALKQLERTTT